MKTLRFFYAAAAVVAAVAAMTSCQEDNPVTPGGGASGDYPETPMTFTVDGTESPVGKAFADTYEDYVLFVASPDASIGTWTDAVWSDDIEYVQVLVLPQNLGRDIDLKAEPQGIYCRDNETGTSEISAESLVSGKMRLDYDEATGNCTLLMSLEFTDGTKVGVNASAVLSAALPGEGNTITCNGEQNPLRAAFYLEAEGMTYLYFTRSEVYTFDELTDMALDYMCVILADEAMTGDDIDITSTDMPFAAMFVDNNTGEMLIAGNMEGYSLDGATGTINIQKTAEEEYAASISVTFGDGTAVSVDFEGKCVSVDYVPEEPNEFTCFGATEAIKSIIVDKSDETLWHIYLTATPDLATVQEFIEDWALHITAPAEVFNTGNAGFSNYKDGSLKFEYDGETWKYEEDGSSVGSLEVYLDGDQLELDFTTYGDLKGHYSGTTIIAE